MEKNIKKTLYGGSIMDREKDEEIRGLIRMLFEDIKNSTDFLEGFCKYGMTERCQGLCLDSEERCYLKRFYNLYWGEN